MLLKKQTGLGLAVCVALVWSSAQAYPQRTDTALEGLAPVSALLESDAGKAALSANYTVTGGVQTGEVEQSLLLPFAEAQQQALRDAFITDGNLAQLADGLGSTLGGAYQARAQFTQRDKFSNVSPEVARVIHYALGVTAADSEAGKYFFGNATQDGDEDVNDDTADIYDSLNGQPDIFGQAYHKPGGQADNSQYGNSRPFITQPEIKRIVGRDYFAAPATNRAYNRGPNEDLTDSPSYPSGHTTYGYTGAVLLAIMVPQRYQQMIARGAEYGNNRIIMGAHYAMDVLGGRTLALYDMAHLLANDSDYLGHNYDETLMGHSLSDEVKIDNFQKAIKKARQSLQKQLAQACDDELDRCAIADNSRFSQPSMNKAFYTATQTYGLPVVHDKQALKTVDFQKEAKEAGYLLRAAFPQLSLKQANKILTDTQGPGGGFLDNGSEFGAYSRIDLYTAGGVAQAKVKAMADKDADAQ